MSRNKRWIQGSIVGSAMLFSGAGTVLAEEITVTSFGGIWETAITTFKLRPLKNMRLKSKIKVIVVV